MTSEEIAQFAETITNSFQIIVIHFHDESESNSIVGYFENNNDFDFRKRNLWNFVRTPILDENNKYSLLRGENIKRIQILSLYPKE